MKHLILGAGNMPSALLPGYIKEAKKSGHEFFVFTPSQTKALTFSKENEIGFLKTFEDIAKISYDVIWPCMKPQLFRDAITEYINQGVNFKDSTIISMMAGKSIETIKNITKSDKVIRLMPNTPSSVGEGVNLIYSDLDESDVKSLMSFFDGSAKNFFLSSEKQIDELTPFSGSGPAYFFEFSRIFEDKIKSFGVSDEIAKELMARTMKGASVMLLNSDLDSKTLRENVTSKGGVTFEALQTFKNHELEDIFSKAIDNAIIRNDQLKGDS